MFDFYLVNVLGFGIDYMVKVIINGEDYMIDIWQLYYVEGFLMGENIIILIFVDVEGNKVDMLFNLVICIFILQEDLVE